MTTWRRSSDQFVSGLGTGRSCRPSCCSTSSTSPAAGASGCTGSAARARRRSARGTAMCITITSMDALAFDLFMAELAACPPEPAKGDQAYVRSHPPPERPPGATLRSAGRADDGAPASVAPACTAARQGPASRSVGAAPLGFNSAAEAEPTTSGEVSNRRAYALQQDRRGQILRRGNRDRDAPAARRGRGLSPRLAPAVGTDDRQRRASFQRWFAFPALHSSNPSKEARVDLDLLD